MFGAKVAKGGASPHAGRPSWASGTGIGYPTAGGPPFGCHSISTGGMVKGKLCFALCAGHSTIGASTIPQTGASTEHTTGTPTLTEPRRRPSGHGPRTCAAQVMTRPHFTMHVSGCMQAWYAGVRSGPPDMNAFAAGGSSSHLQGKPLLFAQSAPHDSRFLGCDGSSGSQPPGCDGSSSSSDCRSGGPHLLGSR